MADDFIRIVNHNRKTNRFRLSVINISGTEKQAHIPDGVIREINRGVCVRARFASLLC